MATVNFTSTRAFDRRLVVWAGAVTGDTITPFVMDVSGGVAAVQIDGTFGGATVTLAGSIDGTTYFTLSDTAGNPVSATVASFFELSTAALYVKPVLASGSGNSVNVRLIVRTQDVI